MKANLLCGLFVSLIVFTTFIGEKKNNVEGAKILGIFHFPSKSHHILGSALLKGLAKRGHQVTMVSPFPDKKPTPNYTDIELVDILKLKESQVQAFAGGSNPIKQFYAGTQFIPKLMRKIVYNPNLKKLMDSGEKFDVAIVFSAFFEPLLGVADKLGAKVIGFSPIGANFFTTYHVRNPSNPSYVPNMMLGYSDKMTFTQRLANTLISFLMDGFNSFIVQPFVRNLYKEAFPEGKPIDDLIKDIDIYLMNSHHTTETIRPYLPNLIQIGGFHLHADEKLSADLKKYLDEAKEGVIYVSFGTNLTPEVFNDVQKQALLKTLAKFKNMKILWKFEEDIKERSDNVRIEKWLPQKSVLAHKNVKLFITHGGMGSIAETIYHGVPVVGIPFFGDQPSNMKEVVKQGYGIMILKDELNEENLSKAVKEVLTDNSYREKIQKRSLLYKEQEMNPMDKAIYWVEHVIKHNGAKHLRPASSDLSFYQYYLLDVIAVILTTIITSSAIFYFVTKKILKCICGKFCKNKKCNKKNKNKKE